MVIHDAATFPGLVLACASSTFSRSGRRVKARPNETTACLQYRGARIRSAVFVTCGGLSKPFREELEKFFIATDELEDKKLDIIGWKGPKVALKAIKDAAKSFAKKEQ
jgi:inorganic pyrophosphatase